MVELIIRILINAAALFVAVKVLPPNLLTFNWGNDWWKLIVVALVFALVNSYIKPIVKALSFPIGMPRSVWSRFVINAAMLLLVALALAISSSSASRSATSRRTSRRRDRRGAPRRRGHQRRLDPGQHRPDAAEAHLACHGGEPAPRRSAAGRSPRRCGRGRRRFGTPLYLTDEAAIAAAAASCRAASPIRGSGSTRSRRTTSRRSIALPRRRRGAGSARTSSRAASGRSPARAGVPNAADHARGRRQDRRRPRGGRPGRRRRATRCCGSRSSRPTRPRPRRFAPVGPVSASGGRPPLDVLFRLNPDVDPETQAGAGGRRRRLEVRDDRDGADRDGRARRRQQRRRLRPRGDPPPRRLAARRGRRVARRGPPRARGPRAAAGLRCRASTRSMSAAGSRSRPFGEPGPRPERFARELPALLETIPADRRPARLAIEPGRFLVARAGWLVARVLHVRDRGGRQVVLDTGMTELIRPALYGGRHPIVALTSLGRAIEPTAAGARGRLRTRGRPRPDLRIDRRARRARPAAAPPRRPRRDPRRRRLRGRLGRRTTAGRDRRRSS